jgi:hypothetical protein
MFVLGKMMVFSIKHGETEHRFLTGVALHILQIKPRQVPACLELADDSPRHLLVRPAEVYLFLNFSYVCPEPVSANTLGFQHIEWRTRDVSRRFRTNCSSASDGQPPHERGGLRRADGRTVVVHPGSNFRPFSLGSSRFHPTA